MTISLLALALSPAACGVVTGDDDPIEEGGDGDGDGDGDIDIDGGLEVAEAPADNDSLDSPAESHFLSITGTRDFTYIEEISHPTGDAQDFVEFEFPNNSNPDQVVHIALDCAIAGQPDAQGSAVIFEDGVETNLRVFCGEGEQALTVDNTKVQTVRIGFSSVAEPSHMEYTLTVIGFM